MEEIKIIKNQIKKLLDSGYIYEVGAGEYRSLDKDNNLYLKISETEEKQSEYSLSITEEGFKINGILINDKIFQEELCDYWVRERADQIDHLIDWIAEATTDKQAMKDDLLYLSRKKGEYLFSSIVTNDYVLEEDNLERFNEICKELLKLNEGLEK